MGRAHACSSAPTQTAVILHISRLHSFSRSVESPPQRLLNIASTMAGQKTNKKPKSFRFRLVEHHSPSSNAPLLHVVQNITCAAHGENYFITFLINITEICPKETARHHRKQVGVRPLDLKAQMNTRAVYSNCCDNCRFFRWRSLKN